MTAGGAMTRRHEKLSVPFKLHEPQRVRAELMRTFAYEYPFWRASSCTRAEITRCACRWYQRLNTKAAIC